MIPKILKETLPRNTIKFKIEKHQICHCLNYVGSALKPSHV